MMENAAARRVACYLCDKTFKLRKHLTRHMKVVHREERITCEECGSTFGRQDNLRRHELSCHRPAQQLNPAFRPDMVPVAAPVPEPRPGPSSAPDPRPEPPCVPAQLPASLIPPGGHVCERCGRSFTRKDNLRTHARFHCRGQLAPPAAPQPGPSGLLMQDILHHANAIKLNLWVECEFVNIHGDTCRRAFKTKNVAIFQTTDVEELVQDLICKVVLEKETCELKGSGWSFVRVLDVEIRVNVYNPLRGSSYIPLPHDIASRKAVINVQNDADERCFEYAVLSKFIEGPVQNQNRVNYFTDEIRAQANLNFDGIHFPVRLDQISIFERNNPGVSVSVFGLEKKKKKRHDDAVEHFVYPLRVVDEKASHFDLLFLTDERTTHYAYIRDFERLVRSQMTRRKCRLFICKRCFAHFDNRPTTLGIRGAERLEEHRCYCSKHPPLRTDVPEEKEIRFKHYERTQRTRFTIYADFECALIPHDANHSLNPAPIVPPPAWDPAAARGAGQRSGDAPTNARNIHTPYAYAYYIRDDHRQATDGDCDDPNSDTFSKLHLYRGEDAARHFIKSVRDDVRKIGDILYGRRRPGNPPILSNIEELAFQLEEECYICKLPFTVDDSKVRDHQHSPPYKYRGAAHRSCNLLFMEQESVNMYLHNLSHYDAHFIVRELAVDKGDVDVLANTEEKYITFSKRFKHPGAGRRNGIKLQFVDSYRLMSKSLAALAEILPPQKMNITRARYNDQEAFDLMRRKGVFPYEHITSMEVLNEDRLPPKEVFGDVCTDEDYARAQTVWTKFQCATLGDYADRYLETDVLLLADVFEGFREMCLAEYNLDPAHYLTLPSYAWDVMLYKTGVILDTLQEVDQYLFFEKGIRGGLTQCVTRHVVANNKFTRGGDRDGQVMSSTGVENDNDTYIMYYDANNLYGWAMSEPLPQSNFEWLSREEIDRLDVTSIPADGEYGYVMEVDLEYPTDPALHDKHRDLPFCPEVRRAPAHQLPFSSEDIISSGAGKSTKLMVTLLDKEEYVIHYRYLQQAMENGLRVRNIHRVMRFKQSPWLKPYVTMNTKLRQQAKNKFEVEMFKLMVNAVYGMSLQNVRKHQNMKIATTCKIYSKYVAKANFNDRVWYKESLALLHMAKVRVVLNKPVYAGMCILDHSKRWMYGFHYGMVERYGIDRVRMAYMDTDGIFYAIRTRDVYRDMLENLDDFDTSNYPRNHICFNEQNARVLGKFKDEAGGDVIKMFVGLMAKLYCAVFGGSSCTVGDGDDDIGAPPPIKRAKGVNRAVVKLDLSVQDYLDCLQNHTIKSTDNQRFQSRHHLIYTVVVRKRSLAPFDDKRYVMPEDGINTLPWGHYSIPPRAPPLPRVQLALLPAPMEVDD